jgi:sensor domain CHASE-containing protein
MSLQHKVIGLIVVVLLIYGALDYTVQSRLILPSFTAIEREEALKDMNRVLQGIERETQDLVVSAADWATWDDSYRFVQDRNDAFREMNLNDTGMTSLTVNLLYFFDAARNQVWGRVFDLVAKEAMPIALLPATLPEGHPLVSLTQPGAEAQGILLTAQGPVLIAAKPIVTSQNQGPVRGTVVFGRFLDAAAISTIAKQTGVQLTILLARDSGLPPESAAALAELEASGGSLIREDVNQNRVYRLLPDLFGQPALLVQVEVPRTISAQGQAATDFALRSLLSAGLLVLTVLVISLRRLILTPLRQLTQHTIAVGQHGNLSQRLVWARWDEFGILAYEFDRMVERLVETRAALIDQSYHSGVAEMASGLLHNIGNAMTPLKFRVMKLNDAIRNAPIAELRTALHQLADPDTPPDRRGDLEQFVELAGLEVVTLLDGTVEQLARIDQHVTHIQKILNEQERFSHAHRVLEALPVADLVREAVELCNGALPRQIHIEPSPDLAAVGAVVGSRVAVQQILINLLKNAIEAITTHSPPPETGRIAVKASLEPGDGGDQVHLRVIDNGIGVPPESLPHLFERGFSTKPQTLSGIGLHWCAITALALGGKLYAESAGVGQGACLHLLLPHAESSPTSLLATGG